MNEFHESVDMNKLYFEYKGSTRDVNIYEYYDSKELFGKIKINQLRFDEALKNRKSCWKRKLLNKCFNDYQ